MVAGIRILGYRNLDEAYAFLRDQQDEGTIYAVDEGADQTEVCLRLADGRWRNPLPRLVERTPYDGPLTSSEAVEPENELDVIANAFLEGRPLTERMAEIIRDNGRETSDGKDGDIPAVDAPPAKVGLRKAVPNKEKVAIMRKADKSWKDVKVPAQFARHTI